MSPFLGFTKKSTTLPRVVRAEESKNGLGFEIGPSHDDAPTRSQLVTDGKSSCNTNATNTTNLDTNGTKGTNGTNLVPKGTNHTNLGTKCTNSTSGTNGTNSTNGTNGTNGTNSTSDTNDIAEQFRSVVLLIFLSFLCSFQHATNTQNRTIHNPCQYPSVFPPQLYPEPQISRWCHFWVPR